MKRIEFIGVRGGHGTTTVSLAAAAALSSQGVTRLAAHDRPSLCHAAGIASDGSTAPVAENLELADDLDGDVCDAGTLESYLEEVPFPEHPRWRDDDTAPLRIAVMRGPDYLGVHSLCAHTGADVAGIVLISEPGRALDARDVEHVCRRPVVAVIPQSPTVARALDAGLFLQRVDRLGEFSTLRSWIAQLAPQEASCAS